MIHFAVSHGKGESAQLLGQMGTVLQPLGHKKGLKLLGKMRMVLETIGKMWNVQETLVMETIP